MLLKRLRDKIQKENLWLFILLLLVKKKRYGYELRELIKEKFGFWSGNVTAYRVLYSLENKDYVKSKKEGKRKYYKITEKGRNTLKEALDFLSDLVKKGKNYL